MKQVLDLFTIEEAIRNPPSPPRIWDAALPGFGVWIHPSGVASYFVQFRDRGKQVRRSIGKVDGLPLSLARRMARELLPARKARAPRLPLVTTPGATTIEALVAQFIARHLEAKPHAKSYVYRTESQLRRFVLPAWASRDVASIRRGEIVALLDTIVATGTHVQANRVAGTIRLFFNWLYDQELIEANPAMRLKTPVRERPRERWLSDQELALVWKGAGKIAPYWDALFKLLMLTGQRRGEVAGMKWAELDLCGPLRGLYRPNAPRPAARMSSR